MKKNIFYFLLLGAVGIISLPVITLAQSGTWTAPNGEAPANNALGPVWLQSTASPVYQSGNIFLGAAANQDFYIRSGNAIRSDSTGSASLNIGNWGSGQALDFSVYGNLYVKDSDKTLPYGSAKLIAPEICLNTTGSASTNCITSWPSGGSGDITDVLSGTGISVSNSGGPQPTISTNFTTTQARVSGSCSSGSSIRSISETGTVTCETDDAGGTGDITAVLAGTGISVANSSGPQPTVSVNTSALQRRVSGTCAAGSSIRAISETGTVTCEADTEGGTGDVTGVLAGTGITVSNSGGPQPTVSLTGGQVGTGSVNAVAVYDASGIHGSTYLTSDNSGNFRVTNAIQATNNITSTSGNVYGLNMYWTQDLTSTTDLCYSVSGSYERLANCSSSSVRYKKNIKNLSLGLDAVMKMRPVSFYYKDGASEDRAEQVGFIAEEIERISPLLVEYKDGLVETVRYKQMTAVLAGAIQELKKEKDAEIEQLQKQISDLEKRIKSLE